MFRKKPNIPPRPLPPTADQIESDLGKVSVDDVVLKLFEQGKMQDKTMSEDVIESSSKNADILYNQVKCLVQVTEDLKELLTVLTKKDEVLQISESGLKSMADEIRQQSVEALK
ncbi:hypothetical protein J437_LFUL013701 [Ladona fulva]|uniref:Uncharacterized protein n=1 Tax=Ladona fulva TaxID=123851 RepID=A0A8K0KH86_LADFU|nr:hypothetical protein J437_LFUL013701 [Ladona fulva]